MRPRNPPAAWTAAAGAGGRAAVYGGQAHLEAQRGAEEPDERGLRGGGRAVGAAFLDAS